MLSLIERELGPTWARVLRHFAGAAAFAWLLVALGAGIDRLFA